MFLKSDYALMVENEILETSRFANEATRIEEALDKGIWGQADTDSFQKRILSYKKQAEEHRAAAEYWLTFIESEDSDEEKQVPVAR